MTAEVTSPATLQPATVTEARDALRDTAGRLAIRGAGTAAGWAGALAPVDTVLDTTALTGVLVHNPGDLTVAVRAGTPMRELQAALAPHRQRVALDAARVGRGATVGGLVATGDAGPLGLAYGSLRDVVIGATVVLADGTVARSGGHVIKNVAGYDLAKLMHGSYGAFALLAEIVLRLHPVPERTATVALPGPLPAAAEAAARVLASAVEPVSVEWSSAGDGGELLVRLEGTASALGARIERLTALLGAGAHEVGEAAWARHAERVTGPRDAAVLRLGCRPSRLPGVIGALPATAVSAGLGTGLGTAAVPCAAVAAAHERVRATGGTSVLRDRPAGCPAGAWGAPPSALATVRAVKDELDPGGRLGPGRFDPWLPA